MRIAALTLFGALGLAVASASANAAPAVPGPAAQASNIVAVAGGCGWRFRPNRWGRCVPNRYSHYRAHPYWRGYYGGGYYGGGYYGGGYYRWGSPSDYMANELNRQERDRYRAGD